MKLLQALVPAMALWCAPALAQTPRLSLWITEAIGATNAERCAHPALADSRKLEALRAKITYRIEDSDVARWEPATASWTLHDDAAMSARDRAWKIVDRCFILWVDGKPVATGVALWTHSARMVDLPVLAIGVKGNALSLRLGSRHGGPDTAPVAREQINSALEGKRFPSSARQ
jgi:hypothetical protein